MIVYQILGTVHTTLQPGTDFIGIWTGLGIFAFGFVILAVAMGILGYKYITIKMSLSHQKEDQPTEDRDLHEMSESVSPTDPPVPISNQHEYASIDVGDIDTTPSVYDRVHNTHYEKVD